MYLNPYQKDILQKVAEDRPVKLIASEYKQSYESIQAQLKQLRIRYDCQTNLALVLLALKNKVIDWPKYHKEPVFKKTKEAA